MRDTWGVPLEALGRFDGSQLELLRWLGATAVEDLFSIAASDLQPLTNLLPGVDVWSMIPDLIASSPALEVSSVDLSGIDYYFGAALPQDMEVPSAPTVDDLINAFRGKLGENGLSHSNLGGTVDYANVMPPVRDQGERSTCVPHACLAVLEYVNEARFGRSEQLSPQHLYWRAKRVDGRPQVRGTLIATAMKALCESGVCSESKWPYVRTPIPGNEDGGPPPEGAESDGITRRTAPAQSIPRRSSAAIRKRLDEGTPVAFSVAVFASSKDAKVWTNPSGKILMPLPGTQHIGNHAMCAVGYQTDVDAPGGGYLIVRNSWGTTWASMSPFLPGYGALPYAYLDTYGLECMTW